MKTLTLKDWAERQPKMRQIDYLAMVWHGWCQDTKCPHYLREYPSGRPPH